MSIRIKLTIFFVTVAILPMAFLGGIIYTNSKKMIKEQLILQEDSLIREKSNRIMMFIQNHIAQIKIIKDLPSLHEYLDNLDDDQAIDAIENTTLQQKLMEDFISIAKANKDIYQLRYIDDYGNELVKVISRNGLIEISSEDDLLNRKDRYFFKETLPLNRQEIFISPLDLIKENNQIEIPHVPLIRIGAPVYHGDHLERNGIVVINVLFHELFDSLMESEVGKFVMIDQDGDFLFHPDKNKEFSFLLGKGYNYFKEQPELVENTQKFSNKLHEDVEEKEFRIWRKVFYDSDDDSKYWIIFSVFQFKNLFAPIAAITKMLFTMSFVILFVVGIISIAITQSLTDPLLRLHHATQRILSGDLKTKIGTIQTKDEIGKLSISFNIMLDSLDQANLQIKENTDRLEQTNKELEDFNEIALGREERIIELKRKINLLSKQLGKKEPYDLFFADQNQLDV